MADAIGPANISHKSDQRIIRVFSASLSGDRGRTAAAAEGPSSNPVTRLQGLSQTASPSQLVATAEEDRLSTTIWSGGAAAGLYLGTGLILAFLVHTHYPGTLGLREWIRVVLSWPLIFFLSK